MYRLGRKQKRAILTEDGQEVVVFPKGKQEMAERVCRLLNAEIEVNIISSNPVVSGQLLSFFLWFRANGELHIDKSIEAMIEIYLKESNLR